MSSISNGIARIGAATHRRALQIAIKPSSTPILIVTNDANSKIKVNGGTGLLWQAGEKRFVVTAAHVARKILELGAKGEPLGVCIHTGAKALSLFEGWVIDIDEDLDIAILWTARLDTVELVGKAFYQAKCWPPREIQDGDLLGFIGFPGELRVVDDQRIMPDSMYVERPCAISKYGSSILLGGGQEPVEIEAYVPNVKLAYDLGGISGAPAFIMRPDGPEWVAVVRQGPKEDDLSVGMLLTLARLIGEDGKIQRPNMTPALNGPGT